MQRRPTVVGLKVCETAIVQEKTRNVTLVNCFRKLSYPTFPARASPFTVCAVLTDGLGSAELTLTIKSLVDLDVIWSHSWRATFKNPLKELWFLMPVNDCEIVQPGTYQVGLAVDKELAAQTIIRVTQSGA
jgi:Family of unknown function (DUF6941)